MLVLLGILAYSGRGFGSQTINQNKEVNVQTNALYSVARAIGYVVLVAMLGAIVYAGAIGIANWSGIGV